MRGLHGPSVARDRYRRANVSLRQEQGKRAAFTRRAAELNFSAKEICQFAADGQSQSSAAVFAAGARVCLLKRLKDDALFFHRYSDTRIGNLERDHRCGAPQDGMTLAPPAICQRNGKAHSALL